MSKINLLYILTALIIFNGFISLDPRFANDLPSSSLSSLREGLNLPQTWNDRGGLGLGAYSISTLWGWPQDLLYSVGSTLGLDFGILQRVIGIFMPITLGWWGVYKLSGHKASSLFYVTTSYFLLLIDGGQLGLAMAYGILPICFFTYLQAVSDFTKKNVLNFVFWSIALSVSDIRIIYMLLLLIVVDFILSPSSFYRRFVIGLSSLIFMIGFHSYWLLPAIMTRLPTLPTGYSETGQISFLSFATLGHSLFLQQPHWYKNVFGDVSSISVFFLIIPVLVFFARVVNRSDRKIRFWLVIALVGTFLVKGSNPPLADFYSWVFNAVPGFQIFRDPVKFMFITSMAYAVLVGSTVSVLVKKFKWFSYVFPAICLLITFPVWSGQMTGLFVPPRNIANYSAMSKYFFEKPEFGRIAWIPARPPLSYNSSQHTVLEGTFLSTLRPFYIESVGTYDTMNFLRESSHLDRFFEIYGIKYLVFPPADEKRIKLKPEDASYQDVFYRQLSKKTWVSSTQSFGDVRLITTTATPKLMYLASPPKFIVGSDSYYKNIQDIKTSPLVFSEEHPGTMDSIDHFPNSGVEVYQKKNLDLIASFAPKDNLIFPSYSLANSPDSSGWWKRDPGSFKEARNFLEEKYALTIDDFDLGGGYAFSEGSNTLSIESSLIQEGSRLFVRAITSSRSGSIQFLQSGKPVGDIMTGVAGEQVKRKITGLDEIPDQVLDYSKADLSWHEVGDLQSKDALKITTQGDINVINAILILPKPTWQALEDKASSVTTTQIQVATPSAALSYVRISPTHYKVTVFGLTSPSMLVFSQMYDDLWRLSGQSPLRVYSHLNGYNITSDGVYDLKFRPQEFVIPGLLITMLTSLIFTTLWKSQ